jgi:histidine ammonia-lyase
MIFFIDPIKKILLKDIKFIFENKITVELSANAKKQIIYCREYLDNKLKKTEEPIYGINTGFGSLCNIKINSEDLEKLQENLVKSHACGTGKEVSLEIVKLMLLLKIQALCYGKSGATIETVERLVFFFNNNILPVVYEQGSLGASGDLAPLAHLSLPLLGLGFVNYNGLTQATNTVYDTLNLIPLKLKSKEGLALLNGTQFMSAYGIWSCLAAQDILLKANFISAISLDAFDGKIDPFKNYIHVVRPHKGQMETAMFIHNLLQGSELISAEKKQVQDPYSFRCIPQVHGASLDVINYAANVFEIEINSVTDNPTIFPEYDEIISGGNFHGQPLAFALDFLAIALSEISSISERRIYLLISGQRNLPAFLVANPGLNSGMMITQYTAASIVSQNKQLCTPASVDSIVSSNGQEDHVSMGANAATKCFNVVQNVKSVLSIELLCACQALEFRNPKKSSPLIQKVVKDFRKTVPFLNEDKILSFEIQKSRDFLNYWKII